MRKSDENKFFKIKFDGQEVLSASVHLSVLWLLFPKGIRKPGERS